MSFHSGSIVDIFFQGDLTVFMLKALAYKMYPAHEYSNDNF